MKRILITGSNSFVGTSVLRWLAKWPDKYDVATIGMRGDEWRNLSFRGYDVVFHVAGIAHSDAGKIRQADQLKYHLINTQLTIEAANKAKADGVKQFIFMSSSIIYGESAPLGKRKVILRETVPSPANYYGESKLNAEIGIQALNDESFRVVIIRSPMVYGKNSKGNYSILAKMALKLPLFPKVENERSMVYIDNLTLFIQQIIDNEESGIFWPQNSQYTNTSQMAFLIAKAHGKHLRMTGIMNWLLYVLRIFTGLVDKAFGSLVYDLEISHYLNNEYQAVDLEASIFETESFDK